MRRLLTSLLGRNVGVLSAYAAASYAVALAAAPVIARLYEPAAVGALSFFSSLVALAALVATGRYEQAIVLARNTGEARALAGLALRLGALATVVLTPLAVLLMMVAGKRADPLGPAWFAICFPLALWATVLAAVAAAARQRAEDFPALGRARFAVSTVTFAGQVLLQAGQSLGLIAGSLLGLGAQLWPLRAGWRGQRLLDRGEDRRLAWALRRHRRFATFTLPAALLDGLAQQLPLLLGFTLISPAFAGFYGLAGRVLALPYSLLGSAVAQVFYPEFTRTLPDRAAARAQLFRTWRQLALIGGPFFVALAFTGPGAFAWVFGAQWREAGELATVLIPMTFAAFLSSPTSSALLSLGHQARGLAFGIVIVLYRVPCFAFGALTGRVYEALFVLSALEVGAIVIFNGLLLRDLSRPS